MSDVAVRAATDATFEADVLERSHEIPVVLDLWAPWCGPCRQLTPMLERVAEERPQDFERVKINVDENPRVATELGARSIPLVIGFKDGKPEAQFVGVQPEAFVNAFVDSLAPSQADRLVRDAAMLDDPADAEQKLEQALELDARHEGAYLALARLQSGAGRLDEARATLGRASAFGGGAELDRLTAELRVKAHAGDDLDALEARVREQPGDIDALIELGQSLGARGEYERAFDTLLSAVRANPKHRDGAARQAIVDLFDVLGAANPLTKAYRPKLARALF